MPEPDRVRAVDALRDFNFAVQAFREAVADHFGIGVREGQAAAHLVAYGQLNAGELSRPLELTPSTVTHLLGRLQRAELATISNDPDDQRRTVIRPTDRAESMISEIRTWLDGCLDSVAHAGIGFDVAVDVLVALREGLEQVSGSLRRATTAVPEPTTTAPRPRASGPEPTHPARTVSRLP